MKLAALQVPNAGAALLLGVGAALFGATAFAQRAALVLPDQMRAPPMRGDLQPTSPADGRVGDPLPDSQLLIPRTEVLPPPIAEAIDDKKPADLASDGAVGDLVDDVSLVPVARPPQSEIDGKVGDLIADVPQIPVPRPSQSEVDGKVGDMVGRVPSVPTARPNEKPQLASYAPGLPRDLPIPPAPTDMSAADKQCRARLTDLGVKFRERPRLAEENGCLVDWPIEVTSLGANIGLEPEAVVNCETALAVAEFAQGTVAPKALASFGTELRSIRHASAYVCRGRVGTGESKMSEHAFGNALDIGFFELKNGRDVEVRAYGPAEKQELEFMRAVRGAACGPFKTVLGPGTNAEHATHFHLDLAQRRRGGTYCK